MTEPILTMTAIAALGGAAGGAAGKLVERGVDAGLDWIRGHFGRHGDEIQRRAEENTAAFLVDLSVRVRRIEESHRGETGRQALDERLANPDFTNTLQNALVAAARSAEPERHALLAEAVATRLMLADDDIMAISENMIVEVLPRLSKQQLGFLGLHYGTTSLRDPWSPPESAGVDEFKDRVRALRAMFPEAGDLSNADYLHLASVGVALHGSGPIVFQLESLFRNHRWQQLSPMAVLPTFGEGQWIVDIWDKGGQTVRPTFVGLMLGGHVFGLRSKVAKSSQ